MCLYLRHKKKYLCAYLLIATTSAHMKRTLPQKPRKVHRNFKLQPKLDTVLKKEAIKQNRTQTALVEMALAQFFNLA